MGFDDERRARRVLLGFRLGLYAVLGMVAAVALLHAHSGDPEAVAELRPVVAHHDLAEPARADALRRALPLDQHSQAPGVVTGYWPVMWKGRTAQGERVVLRFGVGDAGDEVAFRVRQRCWDGRIRTIRWKQRDSSFAVFSLSRGWVMAMATRSEGRQIAEFQLSGEVSDDARSVNGTITTTTTFYGTSSPIFDQCKSEVRFNLRAWCARRQPVRPDAGRARMADASLVVADACHAIRQARGRSDGKHTFGLRIVSGRMHYAIHYAFAVNSAPAGLRSTKHLQRGGAQAGGRGAGGRSESES